MELLSAASCKSLASSSLSLGRVMVVKGILVGKGAAASLRSIYGCVCYTCVALLHNMKKDAYTL